MHNAKIRVSDHLVQGARQLLRRNGQKPARSARGRFLPKSSRLVRLLSWSLTLSRADVRSQMPQQDHYVARSGSLWYGAVLRVGAWRSDIE
jgi:hypothetical protein